MQRVAAAMAVRVAKVATCSLNQWAMDFQGNLSRTLQSLRQAREAGATFRLGPELELTGYGCEDHFLEADTLTHSWECLAEILASGLTDGMVCDIGLPAVYCGVRYNYRVFCLDGRILLIRPKLYLANDGNHRELRWFSAWRHLKKLEALHLPDCVKVVTGQSSVPFGDGYLAFEDTVGSETCEELFTPSAPHVGLSLNGVEIFANGSGSHHQLRKLDERLGLMQGATRKVGGVYLYANQQGCDGGRLYYDGCACIVVNGDVVAQGSQFSLKDVEVLVATVDLTSVADCRGASSSLREQASQEPRIPSIPVKFKLTQSIDVLSNTIPNDRISVRYHLPEEEIALGPAYWLWDYLRRSGATRFFLPLSGGADSSSVAAMVGCMCQLVVKAVKEGDKQVLADAVRIGNYQPGELPERAEEFAHRLLLTMYMGTENSYVSLCIGLALLGTQDRAKRLAAEIGAQHFSLNIDTIVRAFVSLFESVFPRKKLNYKVHGGTQTENLALQNIQARARMVFAYMLASLMPWVWNRPGFLLVLGSANVDEGLRGYLTKYDCSSADINPLGGISKQDIRSFLLWDANNLGYKTLAEVEGAPPTAELEPMTEEYTQTDENDMGMTYEELGLFGRLRKIKMMGPVSMFEILYPKYWHGRLTPREVAVKVKHFFKYYSINRHKMTTLTPSYHAENYSPEDNPFDLRQFLYNTRWPWRFRRIDQLVQKLEASSNLKPTPESILVNDATACD